MNEVYNNAEALLDLRTFQLLFPTKDSLKSVWRILCKTWHSDVSTHPRALEVFQHVSNLHDQALAWHAEKATRFITVSSNGKDYAFNYEVKQDTELGAMYVGRKYTAWFFKEENSDLAQVMLDFKWPPVSERVENSMKKFLPTFKNTLYETAGGVVIMMKKDPKQIPLSMVLSYCTKHKLSTYGSGLPEKHAAWVTSGLLNLACYLEHVKLSHGAINEQNVYVNLDTHAVCLMGGWWYSTAFGTKHSALPELSLNEAKVIDFDPRKSSGGLDLHMVTKLALRTFGIGSKMALLGAKFPTARFEVLFGAKDQSSVTVYTDWVAALTKDCGVRRFTTFDYDLNDIYFSEE